MADRPAQSYASHTHRPALALWAAALSIVACGFFIVEALQRPGPLAIGLLVLTIAVMLLVAISRIYILRLQDRLIRLEMRVRMARLGCEADFERLSTQQLIGLRFAPDPEIPPLARRAIVESLTGTQIKQAVRDWQSDYHRT